MDKQCKNCKHFLPKQEGYSLGQCNFPLPAYIKLSMISPFVSEEIITDCPTYEQIKKVSDNG